MGIGAKSRLGNFMSNAKRKRLEEEFEMKMGVLATLERGGCDRMLTPEAKAQAIIDLAKHI